MEWGGMDWIHLVQEVGSKQLATCIMLPSCLAYSSTLKVKATCSSETLAVDGLHGIISQKIELFMATA
jgi:hypothetical protein